MLEKEVEERILHVLDTDLPSARTSAELSLIEGKLKILMDVGRQGD